MLEGLIHVDPWLVAYAKPSGLLVHRGWGRDRDVAMRRVRDTLGEHVHPVHRLDRGTSGVLLLARSAEAARRLGDAFREGRVRKRYVALVRGRLEEPIDLDHPVPRAPKGERIAARTRFRPVGSSPVARCSLVEARPETGRLHQIRRHLKHLSHPIVGDVQYGKGDVNREYRDRWNLRRLALHAWSIDLVHPFSDEPLHLEAVLPEDLARPLEALGLPTALEAEADPPASTRPNESS